MHIGANGLIRGYQNPPLQSDNVTAQRGIALRLIVGRPPTPIKNIDEFRQRAVEKRSKEMT